MKTEDLNIEFGILWTVLKYRHEAVIRLKELEVKSDYFSNPFHKEFYKISMEAIQTNKEITTKGLIAYFKSLPSTTTRDLVSLKSMIKDLKNNPIDLADLKTHTTQLKRYYVTRKFLSSFKTVLDDDTVEIDEVFETITDDINKYKNLVSDEVKHDIMSLKGDIDKRIEYVKDVKANPNKIGLIETGLVNIDKWIGKQHRGSYVLYEARTGVGKSMMLMGTAVHNFKKGKKVIVITIEMSASDYLFRIDSHLTKYKHSDFAMGNIVDTVGKIDEWKECIKRTGEDGNDLLVYWVPNNCTPAKVHSILSNAPFKPDLVVVDYVGDMSANLKGISNLDSKAQGHCHSEMKAYAGEFNCVIYSAQQTKRGVKKIDTESGAQTDLAGRKADLAIGIQCTKEDESFMYEKDGDILFGRLTIYVYKGRNVPKCKTHIIPNFERMSWIEQEQEQMDGGAQKTVKKENEERMENNLKELEQNEDDDIPDMLD